MSDRHRQEADVMPVPPDVHTPNSHSPGFPSFAAKPRILLLDGKEREAWYRGLRDVVNADWVIPDVPDVAGLATEVDLAIVNDERALPWVSAAICQLKRRQVPTLHIVDGVVEWRNTWENPLFTIDDQPAMPMFQPVLCHKIACLGRAQARLLESWGNTGTCEVVGSLRLDPFIGTSPRRRSPDRPPRVLIATARTPGFTPDQTACVTRALGDLRQFFSSGITNAEPVWRISHDLAEELGVATTLGDTFSTDLMGQLADVDAFICTPSTALLEGMLAGVPVAALDYTNSPPYNLTAWSITSRDHIAATVRQLLAPPPPRMLYQQAVLHDQLECVTPAADRLRQLIVTMATAGREAREQKSELSLPASIVTPARRDGHGQPAELELAKLYPSHTVFACSDMTALQAELGHLRRELARQPQALRDAQRQAEDAQRQAEDAQRQAEDAQRQAEDELNRIKTSLTWRSLRPLHLAIDCLRGLFSACNSSAPASRSAEHSMHAVKR